MSKQSAPIDLVAVCETVATSSKYSSIAASLISQVARAEVHASRNASDAVKRVKRRLHQLVGAYIDHRPPGFADIALLKEAQTLEQRRAVCLSILQKHASTRERLSNLENTYQAIFDGLPHPGDVLDLACGIGPLARPFMPIPVETRFHCFDAHKGLVVFVIEALHRMGYPADGGEWNVFEGAPPISADIALLLKTAPLLMQYDRACVSPILDSIKAPIIVVSFPIASLGGRKRRLGEHSAAAFRALIRHDKFEVRELEVEGEIVLRLHRSNQ